MLTKVEMYDRAGPPLVNDRRRTKRISECNRHHNGEKMDGIMV